MLDLKEVQPLFESNTDPYASVGDLLQVDDLMEIDLTIPRWRLKVRVKALSLEQQALINQAALVKNAKTGLWETSDPLFYTATLEHGIIAPRLSKEQARGMQAHNPTIIRALGDLIWLLSALDVTDVEKAAHALAPDDPQAPANATGGTDAADDPPAA